MNGIAVVILADNETHADMGRLANALELAKEARENDDEIRVVFDGAGTRWVPALARDDHPLHKLYDAISDASVACAFCSAAFEVKDQIQATGIKLVGEYEGHPSIRKLLIDGFKVVTF